MNRKVGFTLIELLIVVAIIAILAAIAVPNFLEAQVRAKVSRVKADMRSMATAIESYNVDNNKYPDLPDSVVGTLLPSPVRIGIPYSRRALPLLSTPISYITTGLLTDPFAVGSQDTTFIGYGNARAIAGEPNPTIDSLALIGVSGCAPGSENRALLGENGYAFQSVGPDRINFALAAPPVSTNAAIADLVRSVSKAGDRTFFYDPTNGTISNGDIVRTAKYQN
jgi:prepilin-type N-terminal cleavage/methylation domain-containing protein